MGNFVSGIISVTIGALMLTAVFIPVIKGTNTSTWTTSEVSLWGVVTLIGIVGLVYGTASLFGLV